MDGGARGKREGNGHRSSSHERRAYEEGRLGRHSRERGEGPSERLRGEGRPVERREVGSSSRAPHGSGLGRQAGRHYLRLCIPPSKRQAFQYSVGVGSPPWSVAVRVRSTSYKRGSSKTERSQRSELDALGTAIVNTCGFRMLYPDGGRPDPRGDAAYPHQGMERDPTYLPRNGMPYSSREERGRGLPPTYRRDGRDRHASPRDHDRSDPLAKKRPYPDPPPAIPPGKRRSTEDPSGAVGRGTASSAAAPRENFGGGSVQEELRRLAQARMAGMAGQGRERSGSRSCSPKEAPEEETEPGELPKGGKRHEPISWPGAPSGPPVNNDNSHAAREGRGQGGEGTAARTSSGRLSKSPLGTAFSPELPRPSSRTLGRTEGRGREGSGKGGEANGFGQSAAERAAAEVAAFRAARGRGSSPQGGSGSGGGLEDAPPAMRDSPSVSGDEDDMVAALRAKLKEQEEAQSAEVGVDAAAASAEGDAEGVPPTSRWLTNPRDSGGLDLDLGEGTEIARSRWAVEEEDEEEAGSRSQRRKFPAPTTDMQVDATVPSPRGSQGGTGLTPPRADGADGNGGKDTQTTPEGLPLRAISMLQSCRNVECFERLNHISEGTYGVVYRAKEVQPPTNRVCALKKVKMDREKEGFPLTSIREINILLSFHHKNIVDVSEVVVGSKLDAVYMVMEFMDHDLKQLMDEMPRKFTIAEVKCLMQQLLQGMAYLHDNWVLHRDLKTSNILYSNKGELKICDFGLARQYGSPLKPYTHNVVTLHYRAPELLLGAREYSTAIDVWSIGCIMAELLNKQTFFKGHNELDQITKIFSMLGRPTEDNWPAHRILPNVRTMKFTQQAHSKLGEAFPVYRGPPTGQGARDRLNPDGFKLLEGMLALDPAKRLTAHDALASPWFTQQPLPLPLEMMPTYPTSKEGKKKPVVHRQPAATLPSPEQSRATQHNSVFNLRR